MKVSVAVIVLSWVAACGAVHAQGGGTHYILSSQSVLTDGCVPPCLCPQSIVGWVDGTLTLVEDVPLGNLLHYFVHNVQLDVFEPGGSSFQLSGFGEYIYDPVNQTQRMILLLDDSLGATLSLDSSTVPVEISAPFPSFTIAPSTLTPCMSTILVLTATPLLPAVPEFGRGDCNSDGGVNLPDAVTILSYLFPPPGGGPSLACDDACDANDDGLLTTADAVRVLTALFGAITLPLPPPSQACGPDPTESDGLDCAGTSGCP